MVKRKVGSTWDVLLRPDTNSASEQEAPARKEEKLDNAEENIHAKRVRTDFGAPNFSREEQANLNRFWTDTDDRTSINPHDNVLLMGKQEEATCRLGIYTKEQYITRYDVQTQNRLERAPKLFKSTKDKTSYLTRRDFFEENKNKFDELMRSYGERPQRPLGAASVELEAKPSLMVRNIKEGDGREPEFIGMWPQLEAARTFQAVVDQYGEQNVWLRGSDGRYKTRETYFQSEPWSADSDFMVMRGWPRALVRWDDNSYVNIDRYRDLRDDKDGMHTSLADPARSELLILTPGADGYVSPHKLKTLASSSYEKIMKVLDLPQDADKTPSRAAPSFLAYDGRMDFVGGSDRQELGKSIDHDQILVLHRREGEGNNSYMFLALHERSTKQKDGESKSIEGDAQLPESTAMSRESRAGLIRRTTTSDKPSLDARPREQRARSV